MTSEKSGCGVSFGTVRITDLDVADDAVILADTSSCGGTRFAERESRTVWVASFLDQVQAFGCILGATFESIPVSDENVRVTQMFTFIGGVIHSFTSCELKVNRRLGSSRESKFRICRVRRSGTGLVRLKLFSS